MQATTTDITSLVQMRIAYIIADQGSISENDRIQMEKNLPIYFEKHLNKDIFAFIEKVEGVVVSMALLLVIEKPSNPHFINGRIGEVLSVYTVPEYRRKGISKRIMQELLDFAKVHQLDYVELLATKDGYPLYKGLGFETHESEYTQMRYNNILS